MNRLIVLALLAPTACSANAESASPQSQITERLHSLRQGWEYGSPAGQAVTPIPSIEPTSSDPPRPFPRVSPRELLPRNWFGSKAKSKSSNSASSQATKEPASAGAPIVNSRVARDSRALLGGDNPTEPRVAAMPRAGSVLSQSPETPVISSPTMRSRVARSIAADVARVMETIDLAEPIPQPEPEPIVAAAPETESVVEAEPVEFGESDEQLPVEVDPPVATLDELDSKYAAEEEILEPVLEEEPTLAVEPIAEGPAAAVRVAELPKPVTKLPLFIGGRYSSVETKSEPTAPPAVVEQSVNQTPVVSRTDQGDDLLLTQQMPVLVSRVSGPRTIVVGREANYRIALANRGDVAAEEVVTRIAAPEWAEVVHVDAQAGSVDRSATMPGEKTLLVWRAGRVAEGEVLRLDLRLIARSGRPVELAVTHEHRPIDGSTLVEVQEPKLALEMQGPEEVLFGKSQTFRLTLSNPGTGVAEEVELSLTPPGSAIQNQTNHYFGAIPAGETRTVEVELTAREAGMLAVNAKAVAEGGIAAEITKEVFCQKAELVVDWRGPADRFAGAPAVYYFRVRNPGTAVAPNVELTARLPKGFEVLPSKGAAEVRGDQITYRAGSMRPGDDKYFELRGVLSQAGPNQFALEAVASDETRSASIVATTEVVAVADLKLDVLDPQGPVATGQEVEYEIVVTNRGANDAHNVQVVGLFSDGIEPHHVDGPPCSMHDGRVAFDTIDRLGVGEKRTFVIHARAYEEGTHLFRAEVLCSDLEIKLAAEETTRFFKDEAIDVAAEGYPTGALETRYPR